MRLRRKLKPVEPFSTTPEYRELRYGWRVRSVYQHRRARAMLQFDSRYIAAMSIDEAYTHRLDCSYCLDAVEQVYETPRAPAPEVTLGVMAAAALRNLPLVGSSGTGTGQPLPSVALTGEGLPPGVTGGGFADASGVWHGSLSFAPVAPNWLGVDSIPGRRVGRNEACPYCIPAGGGVWICQESRHCHQVRTAAQAADDDRRERIREAMLCPACEPTYREYVTADGGRVRTPGRPHCTGRQGCIRGTMNYGSFPTDL
jgi:hypothetical protein